MHETALPSPETVDLGGRCVLPGFTDSHVHFPTWALVAAATCSCTTARRSPRRSTACAPRRRPGAGCAARAGATPTGPTAPPTRQALDEIVSDRPAMLISKDYHALWLNSAALALAGGDLEVEGGVVVRDETGEPTGVLYEEAAWRFKARFVQVPDEEYVEAMREGVQGRGRARRHGAPRQGRLARRDRPLAAARAAGRPAAPRLAVDTGRAARRPARARACAAAPALPCSGSAT